MWVGGGGLLARLLVYSFACLLVCLFTRLLVYSFACLQSMQKGLFDDVLDDVCCRFNATIVILNVANTQNSNVFWELSCFAISSCVFRFSKQPERTDFFFNLQESSSSKPLHETTNPFAWCTQRGFFVVLCFCCALCFVWVLARFACLFFLLLVASLPVIFLFWPAQGPKHHERQRRAKNSEQENTPENNPHTRNARQGSSEVHCTLQPSKLRTAR